MKYIIEMWKRIFDYKGTSGRKEYWIPFAVNAVPAVLLVIVCILKEDAAWLAIPAIVLALYLAVSFIPFISLTVRRLHDTGKSGWWYLVSFVMGVGAVVVILMCAGRAGSFVPSNNYAVTVYGPPEYFDPADNIGVDVYGPPPLDDDNFNPADNTQVAVYGPPMLDDSDIAPFVPDESVTEITETEPVETEETTAAVTEEETEVPEETTALPEEEKEPEMFFTAENVMPAVYGPPEWFE